MIDRNDIGVTINTVSGFLYIKSCGAGSLFSMSEPINESVSVDLLSNSLKGKAYPWVIHWRGRRYSIRQIGLHHTERIGRTLFHVFSVTDGVTYFKLRFDTETLGWKLMEIEHNL